MKDKEKIIKEVEKEITDIANKYAGNSLSEETCNMMHDDFLKYLNNMSFKYNVSNIETTKNKIEFTVFLESNE